MSLFGRKKREVDSGAREAPGLFLFDTVTDALAAERVLGDAGYDISLVAPPPRLRAGCDLAVALPRVEHPGAARVLDAANVEIRSWVDSLDGCMAIADLVTCVDFGEHVMVRAGNMKIAVEKATGTIVNTSGGGCPDIPYLNLELVGRTLAEAPRPKALGHTLCGLMLDRAFAEAERMLAEGGPAA